MGQGKGGCLRRAVARTFLGRMPPQRGPRDKAHNSFTGSSPATQTAEQGTGAVTKGPGWGSGAVGGSQVVLEQGASGRASPDFLCAGPRAARRLSPSIGSLELDALRRPNLVGMNALASRQIVCFVIDVWRTITKPKRAGLGSVSPRLGAGGAPRPAVRLLWLPISRFAMRRDLRSHPQ